MFVSWLRKAPTALLVTVVIMVGLIGLALIGGFVALEISGQDTEDYRIFLNTLINFVTMALAGTGAVAGVSAARSSSNAEDQTNGQLTARDTEIAELRARLRELE